MLRIGLILALVALSLATPALAQDSWNMTEVGRSTGGSADAVAINGSYAYVAANLVLNVLDISDPSAPTLVKSIDTPGRSNGLLVDGFILYVAQGADGIGIYSLFDPADPSLMVLVPTPNPVQACFKSGSRLHVADGFGGLRIYNVSHSGVLSYLGNYTEPQVSVYDVEVVGDFAYLMAVRFEWDLFFPALKILDVSNPSSPQLQLSQEYPWQGDKGEVVVDGSTVYVSDGFSRVYVSGFVPPSTLFPLSDFAAPGRSMELVGDTLFTSGFDGVESFDVSSPSNVIPLGSFSTRDWAGEFAIAGDFAFVPIQEWGLVIHDVSTPGSMPRVGHHSLPGWTIGVKAGEDQILVAGNEFFVLDASTGGSLPVLGNIDTSIVSEWTVDLLDENTAVTAGGGVTAIDISDPTQPTVLSRIHPPGQEVDLAVWNKLVYSAQYLEGFAILDFSDPTTPVNLGGYTASRVSDLAVGPSFVYAAGSGEIIAVDVSDPTAPLVTDTTTFTDYVGEMRVSGGHLFTCVGTDGVRIFDLEVPSTLNQVGVIPAVERVASVAIEGNRAYVADGNYLRVYDVTNKAAPVEVAYHEAVGPLRCVDVHAQVATVGITFAGIYLYRDEVATDVDLFQNPGLTVSVWPNPVRGRANLAFELGWDDDVRLTVYDLAGRRVREWSQGVRAQQPQQLIWSGNDALGQRVSNGVYFYRLTSSRGQRSGSFVLKR